MQHSNRRRSSLIWWPSVPILASWQGGTYSAFGSPADESAQGSRRGRAAIEPSKTEVQLTVSADQDAAPEGAEASPDAHVASHAGGFDAFDFGLTPEQHCELYVNPRESRA